MLGYRSLGIRLIRHSSFSLFTREIFEVQPFSAQWKWASDQRLWLNTRYRFSIIFQRSLMVFDGFKDFQPVLQISKIMIFNVFQRVSTWNCADFLKVSSVPSEHPQFPDLRKLPLPKKFSVKKARQSNSTIFFDRFLNLFAVSEDSPSQPVLQVRQSDLSSGSWNPPRS